MVGQETANNSFFKVFPSSMDNATLVKRVMETSKEKKQTTFIEIGKSSFCYLQKAVEVKQ